jgi:uncharacterized protein (TIGR02246 family)
MAGELEDLAALEAFSADWRSAWQEGRFDQMADLYEEDAWLMTRHQPARKGRDAILAYFEASRGKETSAEISFAPESLVIDGDYAFKTAHWKLSYLGTDGAPVTDAGRSFVVFKRGEDGRWRLWRDIDNHTPDVPQETP